MVLDGHLDCQGQSTEYSQVEPFPLLGKPLQLYHSRSHDQLCSVLVYFARTDHPYGRLGCCRRGPNLGWLEVDLPRSPMNQAGVVD